MARRRKVLDFGGSIALGGNTPCASTPSTTPLNSPTGAITVEAWVLPNASTIVDFAVIAAKLPDATWANGGWALYFSGRGELKFFANHYVTGGATSGTWRLRMHVWQHVAATYDGTTIRLFINGQQVGTPLAYSTPIAQTAGYVGIGATYGAQAHASKGSAVRVYARALSPDEIAARADAGADSAAMRAGLVGEWDFADVAGTTCPDRSGNGASMTLWSAGIASAASPSVARGSFRNHVAQSEDLSASPWTVTRVLAPTAYGGLRPVGVGGMSVLSDDGSAGSHFAQQIVAVPPRSSGRCVTSIYAKSLSGSGWIALNIGSGGPVAWFDLLNGVKGTSSGIDSHIELVDAANGLYRCSIVTSDAVADRAIIYLAPANGSLTFTAPPTQSVAVGGVQMEPVAAGQTTPSPYVATGAAPLSVYGLRERRQNLLARARSVDLAPWTNARVAFAASADGGVDVTDTAASGTHAVLQAYSYPTAGPLAFIVRVRPVAGAGWIALSTDSAATNVAYFNLAGAGALGTVTAATSAIRRLSDGSYLCAIYAPTPASKSATLWIANGNAAISYAGGSNTVRVYAAQLAQVASGFPEFIDTTTAPANANGAPRQEVA